MASHQSDEAWKPIPDFPGYEVSSKGRIRRGSHIKKPDFDRKGYARVSLWIRQKRHNKLIAPLVAESFIGPRPTGMVACHNDGNKSNNDFRNLRWDTPTNNEADKLQHGTARHRDDHPSAKLTAVQAAEIRKRYVYGSRTDGLAAIARDYGVTPKNIHHIVQGKLWKP